MKASDLAAPSGTAAKFEVIGDKAVGRIVHIGDWQTGTNKFGKERTSFRIVLDPNRNNVPDEFIAIYPDKGGTMARAIGEAMKAVGEDELRVGAMLGVVFSATEDVGKGNPLKRFAAQYQPPATVSATSLFDGAQPQQAPAQAALPPQTVNNLFDSLTLF